MLGHAEPGNRPREQLTARLDIVGPFLGPSGYDRHTREFVRGLARQGVEIGLTNLDGWSTPMPPELRDPWFESLPPSVGAETVVHFTMPTHVAPRPGARNVNYTMFEASGIPPLWAAAADFCDLVVVPTRAARDAWTASGVPAERVRVSPLAVDAEFFSAPSEPLALQLPDGRPLSSLATRFLHVGEVRPRKNQVELVRAWLEATSRDDDAVLVLKCPAVKRMALQLRADLEALQRDVGRGLDEAAPLLVLPALLSDEQMRALYAAATHYVSVSRGEGWDLVMMEAAVAGLRLIAPAHTAYLDYLEHGDAEFIPSALVPARFDGFIGPEDSVFFEGLSWWEPDREATAEILRGAIDGTRARQPPPSARIASTYTWDAAARSLLEALDSQRE